MSGEVQARALALMQEGRAAEAAALLEQLPPDPRLTPVLAFALQLAGRYDAAADAYGRAIAHASSQLAGLHVNSGQALSALGRLDEAAAAYQEALRLAPSATIARVNLGTIRHKQGRLADAAREFRAALEDDPDDINARTNLGAVLCALERYVEAETELALAAAGEGEDAARGQAGLAAALVAQDRITEALAVAKGAVARAPDLEDAHEQLANAALSAEDYPLALAAAERACELGESKTTHEMRGAALAGLGRLNEAVKAFEAALRIAPKAASAWRNLARLLEQREDLDFAVAAYRTAIDLDEDIPEQPLAACLARRGKPGDLEEAIAILRRLLAADPDDTSVRHTLAALAGEQPLAPPDGYISGLFDGYASRFEQHLVGQLEYTGHRLVRTALGDERGARAIDLGCGTGLVGVELRGMVDHLTGVDLSPKMIEGARAKGVYDRLEVGDLVGFLGGEETRYDIVTSADVLIYLGDLEPLFAAVASRLAPGGRFAFTVERGDAGWRLEPTARYTHAASYLEELAARHGLSVAHREEFPIRLERGLPVPGLVYSLRAAAAR